MRLTLLFSLVALSACTNGSSSKDDTDVSDTDGVVDTDPGSDTDGVAEDTDVAGDWADAAVGTWTTTEQAPACGVNLELGLEGAAIADQPTQFTLTMTESVALQQMAFTCTFTDATHYTCEGGSVSSGDVTVCLYQTNLSGVGGTVVDGVGTVAITVSQNAVGPSCPPVPPCSGTATATATIAP